MGNYNSDLNHKLIGINLRIFDSYAVDSTKLLVLFAAIFRRQAQQDRANNTLGGSFDLTYVRSTKRERFIFNLQERVFTAWILLVL